MLRVGYTKAMVEIDKTKTKGSFSTIKRFDKVNHAESTIYLRKNCSDQNKFIC
jgi:hypothetical protein